MTKIQEALRRALAHADVEQSATERDMAMLREAAHAHQGLQFEFEPVCVALVRALLASYFDSPASTGGVWAALAPRIAQALFDDPVQRERLRMLWTRLSEEAA